MISHLRPVLGARNDIKASEDLNEKRAVRTFVAKRDLPILALFMAVAAIFLLPGSLHPGAALLGYPGDTFQHAWFLWHFARAMAHGRNPFVTDLIFYPNRVNLAWSTTVPIASTLALPLSLTSGPIVAYNVSLLLQLALAGFFAYLLCLRICGNRAAAAIGGVCFGFSPFLMAEALGHLSLVTAFPIPLYMLALDTLLQHADGSWRSGLATGLALFLTAMAHYNYTMFCVLLTIVMVGVDLSLEGISLARKIWKPLIIAAAVFAILFSPFVITMWANASARPQSRSMDLIEGHSADLLGWFVPSWDHMLFGKVARHWNLGLFTAGYEGVVYLGPIIAILAVVGFVSARRVNRRWSLRLLVTALVFWVLSLGPHIRIWGRDTGVPGPAALFYLSPFGKYVSAPARFHIVAMLCFAALAALGVAHFMRKAATSRGRAAVIAATGVLLALDLLTLPFPLATPAETLQHRGFGIAINGCTTPLDVNGATVVTIPELQWPYPVRSMWMQVNDGGNYALADGYVSYGPNSTWDSYWQEPILRSLRSMQSGESISSLDTAEVRASIPKTVIGLNIGAFVVFDFPRRDGVVDYLRQILGVRGQRQATCTVFDLRGNNAISSQTSVPSPPNRNDLLY